LDENVAAFWVWLNSSKSDDLRSNAFSTSTKSQNERVTEKISFLFVVDHCHDITRREDKCILYSCFRVKSLRFELWVNIQLGKCCRLLLQRC